MARNRTAPLGAVAVEPLLIPDPLAYLTHGERVAYATCPVERYGTEGVARFRLHLEQVAARRAKKSNK